MKVILAHTTSIKRLAPLEAAIAASGFEIREVVTIWTPPRRQSLGEVWAGIHNVPLERFQANWRDPGGSYNPAAGHIRNRQMADYADGLIAVWDGYSRGTKGMIDEASRRGLRVFVYKLGG